MSSSSLRALTRNCEPKRGRRRRRNENENNNNNKPLSPLALALSRTNFLLYGAPRCLKCRAAKALCHRLFHQTSVQWTDHYVDVSKAKNCLQSVGIKTVPTWEVCGKRFGGVFDAKSESVKVGAHVGELVGFRVFGRKFGSEAKAEKTVLDARRRRLCSKSSSSSSSSSNSNDRNDDASDVNLNYLAGASLGDVAMAARALGGGRRTRRRTLRRSGWCKRVAVRLAARGEGKFWCEFGELRNEKSEKVARNASVALEPM